MKFSMKNFFSKYDQARSFLRILSYLLNKSSMGNFFFLLLTGAMQAIWASEVMIGYCSQLIVE